MKNLKHLFVVMGLSLAVGTVNAGVKEGGGGNGLHSTPQQVADEARHMDVLLLLDQIKKGLNGQAILPIQDVRVKNILTQMMAMKKVITCLDDGTTDSICSSVLSTSASPMRVKMKGACVEKGQDRDASVTFHKDSAGNSVIDEICMSAERLSVYPANVLGRQLHALIIHEFSHAAGFAEDDAIYVQNYVMNTLYANCEIGLQVDNRGSGVDDTFKITIGGGSNAVVSHVRKFGGPSSSNIDLEDFNFNDAPGSFKLSQASSGGSLQFNSLEVDGTSTANFLTWGPMHPISEEMVAADITSQNVNFGGKPLKVDLVWINSNGCQR